MVMILILAVMFQHQAQMLVNLYANKPPVVPFGLGTLDIKMLVG